MENLSDNFNIILITWSPDLKTNYENMDLNFHSILHQLKQVLQVFFADLLLGFFVRNNLIGSKIRGNSGSVVLKLVDGFGENTLTKM